MANLPDYWTTGDAAAYLGVSAEAVRGYIKRGLLTVRAETQGGYRLLLVDDVVRLQDRLRRREGRWSKIPD